MTKTILLLLLLLFHSYLSTAQTETLKAQQMLEELNLIKASWKSLHPGLYRFNTTSEIEMCFKEAEEKIRKSIDNKGYYKILSQLSTKIKCGHTYLNFWNQTDQTKNNIFSEKVIPLLYKVINRKFIITHNLSEEKNIAVGDEVISINGIYVKTIIDSLLTVSRSDGNNSICKKLDNINILPQDIDTTNYSLFDIFFPLFFSENFNANNYTFQIKPFNKPVQKLLLPSITKSERQKVFVSRFGEIPMREKNWSLKLLDLTTAYFKIGDFMTWEWKTDYKIYLDSIFTSIKKMEVKNLIVDIRENEGGSDDARNEVLSYLIKEPFGCDDPMHVLLKFLSVPDSLIPCLKTWNQEIKKPKNESDYKMVFGGYYEEIETINKPFAPTYPKANGFEGNIYLITNATNSSTGFSMANIFQKTHSGRIVGESTGGSKQGINGGQFFNLFLPYSGFEIDLPIFWGAPNNIQPDEGVQPDVLIITNQNDVAKNKDPQVEFILNEIGK